MSVPSRPSALSRRLSCIDATFYVAVCAVFCVSTTPAVAYTPESPEVQAMIDKGLAFLETEVDDRLGGKCLVAMAFNKAGYEEDHTRIAEAVKACQEACKGTPERIGPDAVYSIGIALIFLTELNPARYRDEIDTLSTWLQQTQKSHGGWGYLSGSHARTGDTSMTQYAVLSLWSLERSGIAIPFESAQRVCQWLLRTQDPGGAWAYQGSDPGVGNYNRVGQSSTGPNRMRLSMAAAGLGSTYICADLLGVSKQIKHAGLEFELPPAFKPVETGEKRNRPMRANQNITSLIGRATRDGNQWFAENYTINISRWNIYYLYALERYMSFRELAEGKVEKEPSWYNDGVELLADSQHESGAWLSDCGGPASTSFAVLFLMRSTKKSIDKANYGQGLLSGGRGLPKDIANARVQRGRIVSEPLGGKAEDILSVLEDPDNPKFEALVDNPGAITLSDESTNKANQIERFRRLIRGGNAPARRLAVRALTGRRDLDNVPILVYALSDPDNQVAVEARDALRFVSRKFNGFAMPDQPEKQDKIAATMAWKKWYRSIRPDAEFLE